MNEYEWNITIIYEYIRPLWSQKLPRYVNTAVKEGSLQSSWAFWACEKHSFLLQHTLN
jgi:hypothetical protein